mmetsp:Transcript_20024/g.24741  ORF Transcript_20024/g.24741 Transcript_20024/m.24741 type:complete len:259 (-) Transcript_20024:182-958(-)|eukprot:CAMPEP_0172508272 /NCGR_PEP_ID=MMETSP1066-20121228/210719_1 /TAXON_ID=671091 /ORGANISM="Coscinodiscus wailesii, Strain CCMP2513" /LENGTH=258 /DNA_ID=CAMNT_0013286189 /DNA_START=101 /DNA_END=877 /DNA_ORIENTATION=-
MIYDKIFYHNDKSNKNLHDSNQTQRKIDNRVRLDYEQALERQQLRKRADKIAKRQMEMKRREEEHQLYMDLFQKRKEEERLRQLLSDTERRRQYIAKKLEREEERNSVLPRGSGRRVHRSYTNENDRILIRQSNKERSEETYLPHSFRLSQNLSHVRDNGSCLEYDMDAKKKGRREYKKCIDVTPEVEWPTSNDIYKGRKMNFITDYKREQSRDSDIDTLAYTFSNAVTVENSSDDEDESLLWTKLRPSVGQWMEPVE